MMLLLTILAVCVLPVQMWTDAMPKFGAGVNFGRFTVDGRYTFGLSNINKETEEGKAKNRTLAFLAGYRF